MAEQAHKEPTMEEILASIRKIISEDEVPAEQEAVAEPNQELELELAVAEPVPMPEPASAKTPPDDDMFEEFDLSDLDLEDETAEPETTALTADAADAMDDLLDDASVLEPLTADEALVDEVAVEEPDDDHFIDDDVVLEDDDIDVESFETEPVFSASEQETFNELVGDVPPEPVSPAAGEEPMQALTTEATDNAAAGALAKLVAKLDMGSENTLEGLVRELLKPMIKEWLDDNLPSIVEDKVELEVQRISRLAR